MRKLAVHELNRVSVDEYKELTKRSICVVLDNIRSANNVGSVFRTSDAFLIDKIYLTGFSARPPHKDIFKTALGASDSLDWEYVEQVSDCVRRLKDDGYMICAVEQAEASISLEDMDWKTGQKYAIFFGNEVNGISQEVMDAADLAIELPQWGTKHSLNISVCAGIVLWDAIRHEAGTP